MEVPSSLAHLIAVNTEFAVLLCTHPQCSHAQTIKGIAEHLRKGHHEKPTIRRQAQEFGEELVRQDVRFLRNYADVQLPADGSPSQPIIPVVNGFSCCFCRFLTTNRANIRIHANKEHSKQREEDDRIFARVCLQSWYGPKRERYWVVSDATNDVTEATNRQNDATDELDGIKKDVQRWRAEATERRLTLEVKPLVYELDAWLNFTKWHAVLSKSKHDILQTYEFLRYPGPEETRLRRLLRAWDIIKARALDTLEDTDHKDALKWWVSPKNEVASQHPFELPQSSKTLDMYSRMWEQFICYMVRTVPDDTEEATETGVTYTAEQRRAIEDIQDSLDDDESEEGLPALASELMKLCGLVIMQDLSAAKLYDSPLMHYLAVRGIDEKAEGFRGPMQYTNILAGVLWMVRLLALELAIPSRPWPELGISGKGGLGSVRESVKAFRLAHLVEGSFSPASSILTQLAKGQKDNAVHHSPANIHWSQDKQTIYFVGRPVQLPKIGPMCNALLEELREILLTLAFEEELPTIKLGQVVDSTAWTQQFRKANFDFTKHAANRQLNVDYLFNLRRAHAATADLQMLAKVTRGSGEVSWIDSRKHWYLAVEKRFLRKLMVAMHITAGQPARGPELGSIKVFNSPCSARNIIILNGRTCILTMYDKSRKRRGNTDYILRVLPDDLSQLLAQYIVYIRPFARVLDRRESEYLFADIQGPWAGEQLSRELASETTKHLGVRLTVSAWRHVAIGIAVQWLGHASKTWEKDGEGDDQDELELESPGGLDEEEFPAGVVDHIMVRQASHGQRVAQNTYAINGAFPHRLGPQLIAAFEYASVAWHNLFDWKSEGSSGEGEWAKRKRPAGQQPARDEHKRRKQEEEAETEVESEATIGLRRIYGPEATFKSEGQASAMELVHDPRRRTNLIVLPTSAGKSALFLSVAAMSMHKSVIVVVPFAQLITDIIRRALDCGISCMQWKNEALLTQESEQLVVVSADQASSDAFLHYARGLELSRSLAHLFFDECHVAITDTSYRKRLRDLWQLRYLNCPFTCLTATLMVALEGKLRKQLMLPETQIFRRSTMRPRIRYEVVNSGRMAPMKVAIDMVKGQELARGEKGVVYVRTYAVGVTVSDQLGCAFYKATATDKNETVQQWINRPGGWIVATGALGTGINIEGVTEVIHVDRPYGLTSFAQQSGRGGRNGEVSHSVIITRVESSFSSRANALQSDFTVEKADEEALTEYIQTKSCRRAILARHFDQGLSLSCREQVEEVVYCDYCESRVLEDRAMETLELPRSHSALATTMSATVSAPWANPTTSRDGTKAATVTKKAARYGEVSGQQAIAQALYKEAKDDEDMIGLMLRLKQNCIFCTLTARGPSIWGPTHASLDNCDKAMKSQCQPGEFHRWRAGIDLKGLKHCYICGLPQDVCRFVESGTPCEYPQVMFLSLFVLHNQGKLAGVAHSVGFQGKYERELWDWMKQEEQGEQLKWESNLMRVWRKVCQLFRGAGVSARAPRQWLG